MTDRRHHRRRDLPPNVSPMHPSLLPSKEQQRRIDLERQAGCAAVLLIVAFGFISMIAGAVVIVGWLT